ncbi:MAG: nucleotide exchange factor GrpE [Mycoplasmataceae bacterium]|jgi:molecular chaperone GrpE|nr:nucleotide exchange factor GrpE [Mycoplasmataceae bacterium]
MSEKLKDKEEQIEEKIEKVESNNEELLVKIVNLEQEIVKNNTKIGNYEKQIAEFNKEYASKIMEKAEKANKMVQEKIKEIEQKNTEFINHAKKYGTEKIASKLVEIIDQFKKAINFDTDDAKVKNFLSGFKMFSSMFDNLLNEMNVKETIVSVGDEFDPKFMDAFDTTNDNKFADNKVTLVISNAYLLHDRVIKHAIVKVNKK